MTARDAQTSPAPARTTDLPAGWFWAGTACITAAVAAALAVFLRAWPPHEDEVLALFVGRGSLPHVLHTVVMQRGGAPLHFVLAWAVVHLGGGLTALRALSLIFAAGSVAAIAALGARLADRWAGLVASALAGASWVLLFHGVFGRMYSLFLFASTLSFIALLDALERGGRRRFALWIVALLATLAAHPYAFLVLVAQALYVGLRRARRQQAFSALAVVVVLATPLWWADVVLKGRFDVGVGGGGSRLGSPGAVAHYFWWVSGDFAAGHHGWSVPVLLLAAAGFALLARRRRTSGLLTACVLAVPALAFLVVKLHASASPEARHLIFALPFFSTLLAVPIVAVGRIAPRVTAPLAAAAVVVLLVGEVQWAHRKTPALFDGDPVAQQHARADAAAWLADGARPDDVLLGYEPLFLAAWERNPAFSAHALPRADPRLLGSALRKLPVPLGRGIWVFDASDTTNARPSGTIRLALPKPPRMFVARAFGPYLVIRTRAALHTHARYLAVAENVMRLGRALSIGDADVNLHTMLLAADRIYGSSRSSSRSSSTISR
jgi:hypothetical protein